MSRLDLLFQTLKLLAARNIKPFSRHVLITLLSYVKKSKQYEELKLLIIMIMQVVQHLAVLMTSRKKYEFCLGLF